MRLPPRGRRYVVANWLSLTTVVACSLASTLLLISVKDELPERVAVRWNDGGEAVRFVALDVVLLAGAAGALGLVLMALGVGRAVYGSFENDAGLIAVQAGLFCSLTTFGNTWTQRNGHEGDALAWVMGSIVVGGAVSAMLAWWVRPTRPTSVDAGPAPGLGATLTRTGTARLAWVGSARMSVSRRIGRLIPVVVIFVVTAIAAGMAASLVGVAVPLAVGLLALRGGELTIDYSGIGIRGGGVGAPPAIRIHEVRSVGVAHVSGYADFGGFDYFKGRKRAEGWITRSGEALVVHRHGKPDFVVTVDDADEAAAVLATHVARYHAQTLVGLPRPYGDRTPTPAD